MYNNAITWLERHPDIRRVEVEAIQARTALALPDALVSDPSLCVAYVKRLAVVAVERDAPAGVVTDLVWLLENMRTSPTALGFLDYTLDALKPLEGKRDREEIEPVILRAFEGAPDAINKAKLGVLLDLVRQPELLQPSRDGTGDLRVAPVDGEPGRCAAICALLCAAMAEEPLCYLPCLYFCIQHG